MDGRQGCGRCFRFEVEVHGLAQVVEKRISAPVSSRVCHPANMEIGVIEMMKLYESTVNSYWLTTIARVYNLLFFEALSKQLTPSLQAVVS